MCLVQLTTMPDLRASPLDCVVLLLMRVDVGTARQPKETHVIKVSALQSNRQVTVNRQPSALKQRSKPLLVSETDLSGACCMDACQDPCRRRRRPSCMPRMHAKDACQGCMPRMHAKDACQGCMPRMMHAKTHVEDACKLRVKTSYSRP